MSMVPDTKAAGRAAALGIVLFAVGAALLNRAATADHRWLGAFGSAVCLVGLLALTAAVSYEMVAGQAPPTAFGFSLNVVTLIIPAVLARLLLGFSVGVTIAIAAAWLINTYLARQVRIGVPIKLVRLALAGGVVSGTISGWLSIGSSHTTARLSAGALAATLGCLVFISIWVNNSPDALRHLSRFASHVRRAPPVLIAVGAGWLLVVWWGSDWRDTRSIVALVATTIAFVVFGISFIRRGEGFVVAIAVCVAAVFSLGAAGTNTPTEATNPAVLVLGDSYASGEGAQRFDRGTDDLDNQQCRRAPTAYGALVTDRLTFSSGKSGFVSVACSGARARHIYGIAQVGSGVDRTQLQLATGADPDLVLISIGGNDALFSEIGKTCVLPLDCLGHDKSALRQIVTDNFTSVRNEVSNAISALRAAFPVAHIVVVPYPEMLDTSNPDCSGAPLSHGEMVALAELVSQINDQVAAGVAASNTASIWFEGGRDAYQGRQVCSETSEPATMNLIALQPSHSDVLARRMNPSTWLHNSLHPTPAGHALMAESLATFLTGGCVVDGQPSCASLSSGAARDPDRPLQPAPDEPPCDYRTCKQRVVDVQYGIIVNVYRRILPAAVLLVLGGWTWALRRAMAGEA